MPPGTLHLLPAPLDFGTAAPLPPLADTIGAQALRVAARLEHWVVENAKSARAVLIRVNAVVPLARPLQELSIVALPRAPKAADRSVDRPAWEALLAPALAGHDLGLMSEAGLPGLADPGAALVALAHERGVTVRVHAGPSSIALALAASGLNGQSFAFVGYVPTDPAERGARLRELERRARREAQTQIVIETPYRNAALMQALLAALQADTLLSVSVGLTLPDGWSRTSRVEHWIRKTTALPADQPAVFCIGGP